VLFSHQCFFPEIFPSFDPDSIKSFLSLMISQKIVAEFCVFKGCYSPIIVDVLPQNRLLRRSFTTSDDCILLNMVGTLQKDIGAMSLEG